jgi:hypothetical protein
MEAAKVTFIFDYIDEAVVGFAIFTAVAIIILFALHLSTAREVLFLRERIQEMEGRIAMLEEQLVKHGVHYDEEEGMGTVGEWTP